MRRCAKTEQAHTLSRLDSRYTEAAKTNDARAQQGSSVQIIEPRRKRKDKIGARQRILGIAAVDRVSGECGGITKIFETAPAIAAASVGAAQPGHPDTCANGQLCCVPAGHDTDDLMARDQPFPPWRQFAFHDVQVSPAKPAGANPQKNVAGFGHRLRHINNLERVFANLSRRRQNCRFHNV